MPETMNDLLDAPPADAKAVRILTAGWIETPIGDMLAVVDDGGLLRLDFTDEGRAERLLKEMRGRSAKGKKPTVIIGGEHRHLKQLRQELSDYFAGRLRTFTVPLSPAGTEFELKSWEFLRQIPYAQTRSYGQQAMAIGNPAASRAVGAANGRNPIGVVVPCHRVIGANGSLTGFGGGLPRKKWLLDHERKFMGGELFG